MDFNYFRTRNILSVVGHHKKVINLMGKDWKKTSWIQYKIHKILNQKYTKLYDKLLELKAWINVLVFRKASLGFMDHMITTQCTLQCEQCCSLMPFYTQSTHYNEDFEKFKTNLDALLNAVIYIYIYIPAYWWRTTS